MNTKHIAIIGCGNLGKSIANGLLAQGVAPERITTTRRNHAQLDDLAQQGVKTTSDNVAAIQQSDIIILGLKPYNILPILESLLPALDPQKHILVSLASGVSTMQLSQVVGDKFPLYRAMPNTAADVSTSMTCICSLKPTPEHDEIVKSCFASVGEAIVINENLMDAATVLGACGIAYVLRFMRAMIQGGIQIGFDSKTATKIVSHTIQGAAELIIQKNNHPEHEIDKVTTPRGCTIEGLNEMEHHGFSSALIKGIVTSFDNIAKD